MSIKALMKLVTQCTQMLLKLREQEREREVSYFCP